MEYTKEQVEEIEAKVSQVLIWKEKAEKWDKLYKQVEDMYYDENGEERPEDYLDGLLTIGERAATAFGFL